MYYISSVSLKKGVVLSIFKGKVCIKKSQNLLKIQNI